jgi:rfaE bifunctional protein kinase chain/domain
LFFFEIFVKFGGRMREHLLNTIDQFSKRKIVVIGDLIADEFLYGQIARVSREAPVLILEYKDLVRLPGGAANAANNLAALGSKVSIAGVVGQDESGKDLVSMLRKKKIDTRSVHKIRSYATPVKTRILAGAHHSAPQQIVRVDRIAGQELSFNDYSDLQKLILDADGIILSDYGYGAIAPSSLSALRHEAKKRRIPLVVDSRFRMSEFHDVTSITPNITEVEASLGVQIGSDVKRLQQIGTQVLKQQRLRSLLVTQGRFGMTLFEPKKNPIHIPIYGTDEVADVTGAGDTVISAFTLALSCGASAEIAARLANYAGGIVVMKRGTATVSSDELLAAVNSHLASEPV